MKKVALFIAIIIFVHQAKAQALVNNRGASIYIMPGATVIVKQNSVHNIDGLIQNGGQFTIEGNITNDDTLTGNPTAPTGLYKVEGDWINNATVNSYWDTVHLYGNSQLITGTSVTPFYHLLLTGGAGVVKTQTIDATVAGNLNLTDVELATAANEMLVLNTSVGAIEKVNGTDGFVSSLPNGKLTRTTNAVQSYLYPLGTPSSLGGTFYYRPVAFTPIATATNQYSARLVADPLADGYDPTIMDDKLCKVNPLFYHLLQHKSGNDASAIKIFYEAADGNWTDISQWENTNLWAYTSQGYTGVFGTQNTVEIKNWSDFQTYPFALASKKYTVNAGPDKNISPGQTVTLNSTNTANGVPTIEWTPDLYLDNPNAEDPRSTPAESMVYVIKVTDNNGCELYDTVKVNLLSTNILMPTAFSPNGDGVNDILRPLNSNLKSLTFQVWNRWGEKVYETNRLDEGWDGFFRGNQQEMGVYVWTAEYQFNDKTTKETAQGNVTLVR